MAHGNEDKVTLERATASGDDPVLEVLGEPVAFTFRQDPVPAPGTVIAGKYVLEDVIGEGGLGIVVSARHKELDQQVAIKFLRLDITHSATTIERFLREGQLVVKIHSEHVVRVYDVGKLDNGTPYIVLEYLRGKNLAKVLVDQKKLSIQQSVDYVLEACEALAEAHSLGIVHRDLKPDNLFVARKSAGATVLKIVDFGISKLAKKDGDNWKRVTQDGDRFGTPAYMSPEQLKSAAHVSAQSDIWSIGVVLYELVTGTLPFDGAEIAPLITNILTKPPLPLRVVCPGAPAELEMVIQRCLAKRAEQRYRNVGELAQDLAPFGSPETAPKSLERIQAIVKEGGGSIRPPTFGSLPSGVIQPLDALPRYKTLTTWSSLLLLRPSGWRRAALAALVALAAAGIAVVMVRRYAPTLLAPAPAAPPAPTVEQPPPPTAAAPPTEGTAAPSAPAATVVSTPPPRPASAPHRASVAPRPTGKNASFGGRL